jgi:HEAT repeat protein
MSDLTSDSNSVAPDVPSAERSAEATALTLNIPPVLDSTPPPVLSSQLSDEAQTVLDTLVDSPKDDLRRQALKKLSTLSSDEAHNIAAAILQRLPKETDGWERCWMVSALGVINAPGTIGVIAARLDSSQEDFEWVRYWAAIALARMQPANLNEWLKWLEQHDPSSLVVAIALRLLVESGLEEYIDQLVKMATSDNWYDRWAAVRALRRQEGTRPFRAAVEGKFIPILENCLYNKLELADVRFEAAKALGDIQHKWPEAITALRRVLEEDIPDWVRRTCVDALAQIGKPETKEALLIALRDTDAEIRVRAANALKQVLGAAEAVSFIADDLLRRDQAPPEYLDALRQIDQKAASQAVSDNVLHPDPKVAERARMILVQLGGEDAMRILQKQREEAVKAYTDLLKTADDQIMTQFEGLMKQARYAFMMTMSMHGLIFGLGVVVLSVSLYVAMAQGFQTFERFVGVGAAAGSLTILLTLFYRDPLKNIRESVSNLVKVNVVFIGYMRQINQIDATFKQLFLSTGGFGTNEMKKTVEQIQDSVKKTMGEIKQYLG